MNSKAKLILFIYFSIFYHAGLAQNIPITFPVLTEYLRREQVMGNLNNDFSFNYRPVDVEKAFPELPDPFILDSLHEKLKPHQLSKTLHKGKIEAKALPIHLTSVYNSAFPYGWGNGAIIPARGIQTLFSAGFSLKSKQISLQIYPQFHWAQNLPFSEYPENAPEEFFHRLAAVTNDIDLPVRHGTRSINDFLPGNSHLKFLFGSFATGFSTENFWWGPSQFNAILIGDNAQGFPHFTIHTTKPAKTFLGNFEGQYFVGKLVSSGFSHYSDGAYPDIMRAQDNFSWRYFTGLSFSYSPKWLPGLSFGLSRTFQIHRNDMQNNFRAYMPLFAPLPKEGEGIEENEEMREDQNVAVFARWSIPEAKTEIYFEYIRNDHAVNWRDFIVNPEHSRGFTLGFSKYIPLSKASILEVRSELIQTRFSVNNLVRWPWLNFAMGLYDNYQVRPGLTYKGQILGPGTGASGNLFKIDISRVKKFNKIGLTLERLARDQNFYHHAYSHSVPVQPWIDYAAGILVDYQYGNLIFSGIVRSVHSLNYNFYYDPGDGSNPFLAGENRWNLNSILKVGYVF